MRKKKRKSAAWISLLLGWVGIHRFYLGQPFWGVVYIFLMFTGISFLLGLLDAVAFFNMSDDTFDRRYNKAWYQKGYVHRGRYPTRQRVSKNASKLSKRSTRKAQRKKIADLIEEGKQHFKNYEVEEARDVFLKALDIDPKNIALHYNVACAFAILEEKEEAFKHLEYCLENGYNNFDKILSQDAFAFLRIQKEWSPLLQKYQNINPALGAGEQTNIFDQLKYLAEMRDKNLLSEEEYAAKKSEVLKQKKKD